MWAVGSWKRVCCFLMEGKCEVRWKAVMPLLFLIRNFLFFSFFFFQSTAMFDQASVLFEYFVVDFWCIGRGENCAVSLQPPHRAQLEFAINGVIMLGKVPWSDHSFNEKRNFHMHQYLSGISPSTQQSILPGPAAHQVPGLASCLNYSSAFRGRFVPGLVCERLVLQSRWAPKTFMVSSQITSSCNLIKS